MLRLWRDLSHAPLPEQLPASLAARGRTLKGGSACVHLLIHRIDGLSIVVEYELNVRNCY